MGSPRITVVTCLRNEGPYLVDWLAHLRAIGVDTMLAFTNDCDDGTEALLEALAPAGIAHRPQGRIAGEAGPRPQWRALSAAWDDPAIHGAEWLLHLDCDEWIALAPAGDLSDLIGQMDGAQAIALPWRLFGHDGRIEAGSGMVAERFRRAAPAGMAFPALGSFIKTLFRRDGPFDGLGVHRPRQSAPPIFYDDTGTRDDALARHPDRILLWRGGQAPDRRLVQLNHYSTRSVHEFLLKRDRGLPNRRGKAIDLTYWVERNFNTVRCTMIDGQLAGIRAEAASLRDLPGVAAAEAASVAWHRMRLAEILATPAGAKLCGRLVLAGGSDVPNAATGRGLLDLLGAAGAGR
ncbi:MAG: glycosyltransferase family 2 protein [Pseudomonadota bacterium]